MNLTPPNRFTISPFFTAAAVPGQSREDFLPLAITKEHNYILESSSANHLDSGEYLTSLSKLYIDNIGRASAKDAVLDLDPVLVKEFKQVIYARLGKNEDERKATLEKIFQETGFQDPLSIICEATKIRLNNLNAPEAVKGEMEKIMGLLKHKTHNLSGGLPKAYSSATIGAAKEYQKITGETVQVFFGDYANLGKTNEHFEHLAQTLLNLCLKVDNNGNLGIRKDSDGEKEQTIQFLKKVFFDEAISSPLILARDWEILQKIIRAKDNGQDLGQCMTSVDEYQHPALVKRALKSIAEKAGAALTDSMGRYIASQAKQNLETWSQGTVVLSGQGGDEISGIISDPELDGISVSNAIHKNTARISYRYGLNHHEHGKYDQHIYNGLSLGLAVDKLDNVLRVGKKIADKNPCSVLENAYLAPLKENSKINTGLVPFSTEKILLKYSVAEKAFSAFTPQFHKQLSEKFLELERKYSRDPKNPALSGERYTEHVHDLLSIDKFKEDLSKTCEELLPLIKATDASDLQKKEQIQILKDISLRLLLRARAAETISKDFKRSGSTEKLFKEKAENNLSVQTIADYITEIRDLNKTDKNLSISNAMSEKANPIRETSLEDIKLDFAEKKCKTLLFTSPVQKEIAKLDIWLGEILKKSRLDNDSKNEIKTILQDLIQLKEEKDPVTGTLHGDNLVKLIQDWATDIKRVNNEKNFPKKANANADSVSIKGREVERREEIIYPNEPLMIGFNVMNLAAFNKELSVRYADKFLKRLANKLCELLEKEGFKNPENLVLHRGGAKFVVLLKPYQAYYNEARRFKEDFFSGNDLHEKAVKIQKAFLNYVTQLNNLEVDDLVLENENKNTNILTMLNETYKNIRTTLNTDLRDLFSDAKKSGALSNSVKFVISSEDQVQAAGQFSGLKVGDLKSPKDHNIKGVNLATSSMYRIGTNLNDPASTIDSLFRDAENMEAILKESYKR